MEMPFKTHFMAKRLKILLKFRLVNFVLDDSIVKTILFLFLSTPFCLNRKQCLNKNNKSVIFSNFSKIERTLFLVSRTKCLFLPQKLSGWQHVQSQFQVQEEKILLGRSHIFHLQSNLHESKKNQHLFNQYFSQPQPLSISNSCCFRIFLLAF